MCVCSMRYEVSRVWCANQLETERQICEEEMPTVLFELIAFVWDRETVSSLVYVRCRWGECWLASYGSMWQDLYNLSFDFQRSFAVSILTRCIKWWWVTGDKIAWRKEMEESSPVPHTFLLRFAFFFSLSAGLNPRVSATQKCTSPRLSVIAK